MPLDGNEGARVHKSAETILRSTDRMDRLIADLSVTTKLQAIYEVPVLLQPLARTANKTKTAM